MKNKKFECEDGCKHQYVEMVVLGCEDCIKKVSPLLNDEQLDRILELIHTP